MSTHVCVCVSAMNHQQAGHINTQSAHTLTHNNTVAFKANCTIFGAFANLMHAKCSNGVLHLQVCVCGRETVCVCVTSENTLLRQYSYVTLPREAAESKMQQISKCKVVTKASPLAATSASASASPVDVMAPTRPVSSIIVTWRRSEAGRAEQTNAFFLMFFFFFASHLNDFFLAHKRRSLIIWANNLDSKIFIWSAREAKNRMWKIFKNTKFASCRMTAEKVKIKTFLFFCFCFLLHWKRAPTLSSRIVDTSVCYK